MKNKVGLHRFQQVSGNCRHLKQEAYVAGANVRACGQGTDQPHFPEFWKSLQGLYRYFPQLPENLIPV
ncbi:MAG: hypothetical protein RML36_15590 [Anaerolineae bacterium]|nr:hypothetical protein [Anaerolineae bacterium]MDW8100895.1 hypothetical protein [Anaerolineae bacterium]